MGAGGALRRVARRLLPATVADRVASSAPHGVNPASGGEERVENHLPDLEHASHVRHRGHR